MLNCCFWLIGTGSNIMCCARHSHDAMTQSLEVFNQQASQLVTVALHELTTKHDSLATEVSEGIHYSGDLFLRRVTHARLHVHMHWEATKWDPENGIVGQNKLDCSALQELKINCRPARILKQKHKRFLAITTLYAKSCLEMHNGGKQRIKVTIAPVHT